MSRPIALIFVPKNPWCVFPFYRCQHLPDMLICIWPVYYFFIVKLSNFWVSY